jgi:hypothetical protein
MPLDLIHCKELRMHPQVFEDLRARVGVQWAAPVHPLPELTFMGVRIVTCPHLPGNIMIADYEDHISIITLGSDGPALVVPKPTFELTVSAPPPAGSPSPPA